MVFAAKNRGLLLTKIILMALLCLPNFASAADCDVSISINANKEVFENGEKIYFYTKLNENSFDYKIEYWIEDMFGGIVKPKRNTTSQAKKSFTPKNIDSHLIIKARIVSLGCDDFNTQDNFAEKKIFLEGLDDNYARGTANTTNKTIEVSFSIDKERQKLEELAENLGNENGRKEEYSQKYGQNNQNKEQNDEENKLKKYIPYFLITLLTLISAVLIWRR